MAFRTRAVQTAATIPPPLTATTASRGFPLRNVSPCLSRQALKAARSGTRWAASAFALTFFSGGLYVTGFALG